MNPNECGDCDYDYEEDCFEGCMILRYEGELIEKKWKGEKND